MPTVYIVNWGAHDYSSAKRYGKLVALTWDRSNPFATDRLLQELTRRLQAFDPQKDYLLLSGDLGTNALAVAVLCWRFRRLKVLLWHAKEQRYVSRTITVKDRNTEEHR